MNPSFAFSLGNRAIVTDHYRGAHGSATDYEYVLDADHFSLLLIDSNDGVKEGLSPMNFTTKNSVSMSGVLRLGLQGMEFVWDLPNVNPRNNTFTIIDGITPRTIVVPTGFYTTKAALAAAMQTAVQAAGGGLAAATVTINAVTQQIVITNATAFAVTGAPRAQLCMGIRNGTVVASGAGPFVYTGYSPTLIYSRYFDFESSALTRYQRGDQTSATGASNLLLRIFYPTPFEWAGTPTNWSFDANTIKFLRFQPATEIGRVDIALRDEFGDIAFYDPAIMQFSYVLVLLIKNAISE